MLEWLQLNIKMTTLIWLFPVMFMLHEGKEKMITAGICY